MLGVNRLVITKDQYTGQYEGLDGSEARQHGGLD
jgi:hypothetical protein